MDPYSYTVEGIPVFTTAQVDLFGCPIFYGYESFQVIETNDSIEYVSDYKMEREYDLRKDRPPHRYVRAERFATILSQLMAQSINVSKRVMQSDKWLDMIDDVADVETNHWVETRRLLKLHDFRSYYNRIPGILALAKGTRGTFSRGNKYRHIMKDFEKMDKHFHLVKGGRKYFPNLRFTALMLMRKHGVVHEYEIPLAITKCKIAELNDSFERIWRFINEN